MKIMSAAVAALVATSIVLGGCGQESSVNPDTAPPQAPQIYAAYMKDADKAVLKWTPGAESDLAGYNVYRMGPKTRVNAAPVTSPFFVETNVPAGERFYLVTAVDRSGNESAPSAVVKVLAGALTVTDVTGESARK